ncbi:MAG: CHASE2 domain-containing protein, partial [Nitrospirae bacterium]
MALVVCILGPSVFDEQLEPLFYDIRLKIKNHLKGPEPPEDIFIVAIDEKSLKEFGRWPWSRTLQAKLIERILSAGPKVLAIDILYPEPESPEADRAFKKALSKGAVVLALGFEVTGKKANSSGPNQETDLLWDHALVKIKNYSLLKAPEAERPLIPETVMPNGVSLGHVYSLPDRDGKTRWEYLYLQFHGDVYPSLAVQTVRVAEGLSLEDVVVQAGQSLRVGTHTVPTDPFGRMLINYLGKEGTFRYISAADILKAVVEPSILKDKIVLLGTSAIATYDIKVTPLSANMPGVEKNATVVENILRDRYIKKAPLLVDLLTVLIIGFLMMTLLPRFKALKSVAVGLAIILSYLFLNLFLFAYQGLWLNLSVVSIQMGLIFVYNLSYKYFLEERQARHLKRLFSSYVSEKIVKELIENPEMAGLGGRRRDVTVLFSDIVGFTSLSERLEPEHVVTILNEFFSEMVDVI